MDTKVNMDVKIYEEITQVAEKLEISRSEVINRVVKYFEKDHRKKLRMYGNVMYQKTYNDINIPKNGEIVFCEVEKRVFKQFHLSLNEIEFEVFTDMRKFFKMSVSLIIAESVRLYLNLLLKHDIDSCMGKKMLDNSPVILFPGRSFFWESTNFGYRFIIEWGYPNKISLNF